MSGLSQRKENDCLSHTMALAVSDLFDMPILFRYILKSTRLNEIVISLRGSEMLDTISAIKLFA